MDKEANKLLEILQRLKKAVAYLKGQQIIRIQQDIVDHLVVNKSSVSQALKGEKKYLTESFLKKFCSVYGMINLNWLLTGEGSMLKDSEDSLSVTSNSKKGVPYYDLDFTASFLEVENNQLTIPNSYIDHPFFKGCDYVVRASGQSMAKVLSHGDAIGLIRIENWTEFLPFGEIYAIVTSDGFRMIKVITKGESEDTYTLISKPTDNKKDEFPPQQIKKKNIVSIFKVQASSHLF